MKKRKIVITLGVFTALMPFLGFPGSWEDSFMIVFGILIVLLSADLSAFGRKKRSKLRKKTVATDVFVENAPGKAAEEFKNEFRA